MGRSTLIATAACGLTVAAFVYFTRYNEPTSEELTEQVVELLEKGDEAGATALIEQSAERNMNSAINIKGRVEDEMGNLLSGVTIEFQQTHLAANPANATSQSEKQTVDGRFEFNCDDCSAIGLTFAKGGFHGTRREWFTFGPGVKASDIVDNDVVVILQARGVPAQLENYFGRLETGKRTNVLAFSFGRSRAVMSPDQVAELARAKNIDRAHYLELLVDRDLDGSIVVEDVLRPGIQVSIQRPRNPILDFGNANGGAIAYEPTEKNLQLIEREMSRAPSTGYLPSLDLTRVDGLPQYFYCRIGDRYGRGFVGPVGLRGPDDKPDLGLVSVTIDLNVVAGDRNLTPR